MPRDERENLFQSVSPEIEAVARADYEAARKNVGGRPRWEKLDPCCAYDMGMRNHAIARAKQQLEHGLATTADFINDVVRSVPLDFANAVDARGNPLGWEE